MLPEKLNGFTATTENGREVSLGLFFTLYESGSFKKPVIAVFAHKQKMIHFIDLASSEGRQARFFLYDRLAAGTEMEVYAGFNNGDSVCVYEICGRVVVRVYEMKPEGGNFAASAKPVTTLESDVEAFQNSMNAFCSEGE
ncbi:MAG: hypothetical protein Q8P12_00300 [bacterium]|nr:hypothetical protein [bacterium]